MLLGQFLLLTFAMIIFTGTIYPIVSEALSGVRFNIQAPYFNAFAPYLGLGFILSVSVGNMRRFRSEKWEGGPSLLLWSLLLALPLSVALLWWGEVGRSWGLRFCLQALGSYLCAWAALCLTLGMAYKIRNYRKGFLPYFRAEGKSVGAYLAHLGVVVAIFGFLGNYRGVERTVTLKKGEYTQLLDFELSFEGISTRVRDNVELFEAPFRLTRYGEALGTVTPARSKYPTHQELLHEVGLWSSWWHDVYLVLADFTPDQGGVVTVQIHINPTVRVVWQSAFLMVLGGLVALLSSVIRRRSLGARL